MPLDTIICDALYGQQQNQASGLDVTKLFLTQGLVVLPLQASI